LIRRGFPVGYVAIGKARRQVRTGAALAADQNFPATQKIKDTTTLTMMQVISGK
jgi:hypothetical protein